MGSSPGRSLPAQTLPAFIDWLAAAPSGTTLEAATVRELLSAMTDPAIIAAPQTADVEASVTVPTSWRERLWTAPAETRIGVIELAEALDRPKSWVYRHTMEKAAGDRLPHRKLDGELQFIVGEVRAWMRDHEELIVAGKAAAVVRSIDSRRFA